jgi:MFS family permease/ubiquinone/menaquinone biosynthesis C-methylase UbiE
MSQVNLRQAAEAASAGAIVETDIPARLDRLPWGRFHTLVVAALGITWILDGLEVTLAGAVAGALRQSPVLRFSSTDIGIVGSAYLGGAVLGAVFFGWLTDRWGRKKLFFITLAVYLTATAATALTWNLWTFALTRFVTGAGIGGEYAAINSTIQELIPARVRGWTDLVINGSFWVGAAIGATGSIVLLDPSVLPVDMGWRAAFGIGAVLGLVILFMRMWLPESPRWLATHGRGGEAEMIVSGIEERFRREGHQLSAGPFTKIRLRARTHTPLGDVLATLFHAQRQRTLVGLALMGAQAFFYNAIFFTYALVLTEFYGIRSDHVGWYILPFAAGNFLGPVVLGRLFDTWGRRPMLTLTYALSGILLAATGWLFAQDLVSAPTLTMAWMVIFFFASSAASAAYLTVSETFPLEIRALAIAFFYAIGTGIGGVAGPLLFGALIETGSRASVFTGYLIGSALMLGAAYVASRWSVAAERRPLEDVARPLALEEDGRPAEHTTVTITRGEIATMMDEVAGHYTANGDLARAIAESLRRAGKDVGTLTTADLATVDEFHIRGRKATLELAQALDLDANSHVLDIGSGLGGPARTLAETYGCRVSGIDLTPAFCEAAATLSSWVGLGTRVDFRQGDATSLPFADGQFDAAMTIHVAMNIAHKDRMYAEARRVLKPGGRFGVYDVLQGEGGEVLFPVPWAREPSISHLATPEAMQSLLKGAGFKIVDVNDSTEESQRWFEAMAARATESAPAVTFQIFLGSDFPTMLRNQVSNLRDRRIRTVSYVCQA